MHIFARLCLASCHVNIIQQQRLVCIDALFNENLSFYIFNVGIINIFWGIMGIVYENNGQIF